MALSELSAEREQLVGYLLKSQEVIEAASSDENFLDSLIKASNAVCDALSNGSKILICGNGGSAADCQHIAGEFVSRFNYDRPPVAAVALTTDTSVLTAIGNDYGYDRVFERQVRAVGSSGDVLFALSTSGKSPNIIEAMRAAQNRGMFVIGFSGKSGGHMPPLAQVMLHVPSDSTPLIQQVHITAAHMICDVVERRLFPRHLNSHE